jgi:predicted Fe-Mo cluster-binding NifX family protein
MMKIKVRVAHLMKIGYHAFMKRKRPTRAVANPKQVVTFVTPEGVTGVIAPGISMSALQAMSVKIKQRIAERQARRQAQADGDSHVAQVTADPSN